MLPDDERARQMITLWVSCGKIQGVQCQPATEALAKLLQDEAYRTSLLSHYAHTFSWEFQAFDGTREIVRRTGRVSNAAALLDRFLDQIHAAMEAHGRDINVLLSFTP
jgi:hypothetical protein